MAESKRGGSGVRQQYREGPGTADEAGVPSGYSTFSDLLGWHFSHHHINEAQLVAGRDFEGLLGLQARACWAAVSVDFDRTGSDLPLDRGRAIQESRARAHDMHERVLFVFGKIERLLGRRGYELLRAILSDRRSYAGVAQKFGDRPTIRQRSQTHEQAVMARPDQARKEKRTSAWFRECLQKLADSGPAFMDPSAPSNEAVAEARANHGSAITKQLAPPRREFFTSRSTNQTEPSRDLWNKGLSHLRRQENE